MNRQLRNKSFFVNLTKKLLLLPILVASLLAAAIAPAMPAVADDPPQFALSMSSGRPGLNIQANQVDPCPPIPNGFDGQELSFTFIDANNVHTSIPYGTSTDTDGSWQSPANIRIPYRDNSGWDAAPAASVGMASVQARCVAVQWAGDEMDPDDDIRQLQQTYEPQSFNVNGPSLEFTLSTTVVSAGEMVQINSIDPCPGVEVSGAIFNEQAVANFYALTNPDGSWSVNARTESEDMGEYTNLPAGEYGVYAFCMTQTGQHTYNYDDQSIEVQGANYVALGDSYSSGEGIEPFEEGTAIPGVNECHRSPSAYARILESNPALGLDLGSNGFAACSGAKTADITLGNPGNNEGAQLDRITADTELVTMTIGGNNIDFSDYARACVRSDCSGSASSEAIAKISTDLIPQMEYTLGTIRDRLITLNNSDARVLVIGYPHVLAPVTGNCLWLNNQNETEAIRNVTNTLNTAIENEVDAIGYGFRFVSATGANSPFVGHELCQPVPNSNSEYFIGINIFYPPPEEEERYVFHPNGPGQAAYAELINDHLSADPL